MRKNEIEEKRQLAIRDFDTLLTPLEERSGLISPVTFVNRDKEGRVQSVRAAAMTTPMNFADYIINYCANEINEMNDVSHFNYDELHAISFTIGHTFASRARGEFEEVYAYVIYDITSVLQAYSNNPTRRFNMPYPQYQLGMQYNEVPNPEDEMVNAHDEIYNSKTKYVQIPLTDMRQYGSLITEHTIPYIANAILAEIMQDVTNKEYTNPEVIEILNDRVPEYWYMFMVCLTNLLQLANAYRQNNPAMLVLSRQIPN